MGHAISLVAWLKHDEALFLLDVRGLRYLNAPSLHNLSMAVCLVMQVNLKLFTPAPNKRRTVLLFVFRDMTKTPLNQLKATWEEDLQRMWNSITKPPDYDQYSFSDFFDVSLAKRSAQTQVTRLHAESPHLHQALGDCNDCLTV